MKLAVEVVRAHRLKPTGRHGTTNPFVEVEFDGQRRRTATKLNDLNPSWNETLVFDVSDPLDLPDRTIDVSVFHERLSSSVDHRRRRRSFLGRVCLLGSSVASSRLDAALQLCPLDKRSLFFNVRGEITLRLYACQGGFPEGHDGRLLARRLMRRVSVGYDLSKAEDSGEQVAPRCRNHAVCDRGMRAGRAELRQTVA
uniref:C2 domain-containing protein n=1 Tax=Musa acuminata subsp. malaccensis TaxID=214687 RepID=A0A804KUU8_MUSAM